MFHRIYWLLVVFLVISIAEPFVFCVFSCSVNIACRSTQTAGRIKRFWRLPIINSLLCWSVILLMFIQTLDHSWNWKSENRLAVNKWFWNFFFEGLAKGLRMLRSSWILNQCNLYCKIVKYCILKTVPHSYCLTSYVMCKWYKRLVYTYPALLARLCKVKLSNAKNSACFFHA